MAPDTAPDHRPALSRFRERLLGPRQPQRDTAMSAIRIVGEIERANFSAPPDVPIEASDDSVYVDTPWELRND